MSEELTPIVARLTRLESLVSGLTTVSLIPGDLLFLPVLADITLHPNQSPPGAGRTDVIDKSRKAGCRVTVTITTAYEKVSESREPSTKDKDGKTVLGKLISITWKVTINITIQDVCTGEEATIKTLSFETHLKLKPGEFDVPKPKTMKKSDGTEIDVLEYPNGVKVKLTRTPTDPKKPEEGKVKVEVEMEDVGSEEFNFG